MKLKCNAPATLTFVLICAAVLATDLYIIPNFIQRFFTAEGKETFLANHLPAYARLFSYIFGHTSWEPLMANAILILLLGPVLEEKNGSMTLWVMIILTAFAGGLLNAFFFPSALLGPNGIIIMMIVLTSFANIKKGEIPLTTLLIVGLYLSKAFFQEGEFSIIFHTPHIVGGVCGAVFGLLKSLAGRDTRGPWIYHNEKLPNPYWPQKGPYGPPGSYGPPGPYSS